MRSHATAVRVLAVLAFVCAAPAAAAQRLDAARAPLPRLTLRRLVDPATRIEVQGRLIRFALHGLVYFDTLDDLFAHVDREAGRWRFDSDADRQAFADGLMRRGVESPVVSMDTELPLEVVLTHSRTELARAVAETTTRHRPPPVFKGRHWQLTTDADREAFLRVRDRWAGSLNCWSQSSSIAGRVLANWFIIDEGIELFGATYDSTEHFYFANAYAVEFLRRNLERERLQWFHTELARVADGGERARAAQQRRSRTAGDIPRFAAVDAKILWGDLADVFHLIVTFEHTAASRHAPALARIRASLVARHFDAVYLSGYRGGRIGFLSPEFQALMLEIWKVKYLQIPRLNEVIRSTAGRRLDHFLNDGDSPGIPIPIYSEYLGACGRPRPESYLALDREPAIGYPTIQPAAEHAVDFIVRAIKAHPDQVTLFVLGPATNVALAIRKNPEIVPLVRRVYYMGGAIDVPGNTTPAAEFNWWFDPEAVHITLRAPFREQVVVPIDVAERVFYTKEEYSRIAAAPDTPITKLFRQLHGPRFTRDPAARSFVWDALTTAIFLQPAIATRLDDRVVDVDVTYGPNDGRSIGYHQSRQRSFDTPTDFPAGTRKMKVLMDVDRKAFWDLYVDLMTRRR